MECTTPRDETEDDVTTMQETPWDTFVRNASAIQRKYAGSEEALAAIEEVMVLLAPIRVRIQAMTRGDDAGEDVEAAFIDPSETKIKFVREQEQMMKGCWDLDKYDEGKVIRCQKVARGWIGRRRLKLLAMRALSDPSTRPLRKRNDVWREILSTESSYVHSLSLLDEKFIKPIKAACGSKEEILSSSDIKSIFSNSQQLRTIHSDLFAKLEASANAWPTCNNIGSIFLEFAPYLRLYQEYVNNFGKAYGARQKNKENTRFQALLAERSKDKALKNMQLSSFLIMPVQRPPRYQMLLRELLKYTPEEHTDYSNIANALEQIEQITQVLDQRKKEVENLESIFTVFNSISGALPVGLDQARRYVREGPIVRPGRKKKRYFILFNDILLICVINSANAKVFEEELWMKDLSIDEMADTPSTFQLVKGKNKWKFQTATATEKDSWVIDLTNYIAVAHGKTQATHDTLLRAQSCMIDISSVPKSPSRR